MAPDHGQAVPPLPVLGHHHRHHHRGHHPRGLRRPLAGHRLYRRQSLLLALLLASLFVWYRTLGSVSINTVNTPKAEMFYWVTIMFSQTLGTALGDWTADTGGMGYGGGVYLRRRLLAWWSPRYYWTKVSRVLLFWAAFILTRPLGAVVGDFLDKPLDHGGLNLSRYVASAVLVALVVVGILIFKQRPAAAASH